MPNAEALLENLANDQDLLKSIGPAAVRKCSPEKLVGIIADIAANGQSDGMRLKACALIVQCYKIGAELLGSDDPDDDRDLDEMQEEFTRLMARSSAARDEDQHERGLAEAIP